MNTRSTSTEVSLSRNPTEATWDASNTTTPMEKGNTTTVTEFILLGFQASQNIRLVMFFLLLLLYFFTIFTNLLIITLVSITKNLQTPMYFFLTQLSLNDIMLTTDIVPNMLYIIVHYRGTITFIGCMTQLYFFSVSEAFECVLLTVMSYDRYVAICNPLRYTSIMTGTCCVALAVIPWLFAFSSMLIIVISMMTLNFCGPNIIDHFYCDLVPVPELSCSDPYNVQMEVILISFPLIVFAVIIIISSYVMIIITTLKIPSSTGRQKAFSTCSSHLIVVSIYYGTLFGVYIVPTKGQSSTISKIISLIYTVFTPLINPVVYSLKNNDIKNAVHRFIHKQLRCFIGQKIVTFFLLCFA